VCDYDLGAYLYVQYRFPGSELITPPSIDSCAPLPDRLVHDVLSTSYYSCVIMIIITLLYIYILVIFLLLWPFPSRAVIIIIIIIIRLYIYVYIITIITILLIRPPETLPSYTACTSIYRRYLPPPISAAAAPSPENIPSTRFIYIPI